MSRGMARLAMGVWWGGEACAAAQLAAGGGSRQSRRRLFERLEQEEQRLKKHDGRSMGIQQSLLARQPFFRKAYGSTCSRSTNQPQICGKQHTTHLPLFLIIYSPFANY